MFFDLGNVVLFFSHDKMCRQIAACTGSDPDTIRKLLLSGDIGRQYEIGKLNARSVHQLVSSVLNKDVDFETFTCASSDIFTPNEPLAAIIRNLKKNQTRLILLSNTVDVHFEFAYKMFPILHLFDDYILSYQVGARKPEPQIYEAALAKSHCPKEQCFYTDDIPEFIASARQLGIDAEQFLSAEDLYPKLQARGFLERTPQ